MTRTAPSHTSNAPSGPRRLGAKRWFGLGAAMVCALSLGAPDALAQPVLSGLSAIASASPQEIMSRLRRGHRQVDSLLRARQSQAQKVATVQRDRDAAAGRVDALKQRNQRGAALEKSLRAALVLDENYTFAQSQLAALDGEIAREGAQLLRLYDAILIEKNKEARRLATNDPRRKTALKIYRQLTRQRDGVRQALLPVMGRASDTPSTGVEFVAQVDDDIESLMDKADLARDLETRFLRRAQAVRKRIRQLEAERALAQDVIGIASTDSLFDESDNRVLITRGGVRAGLGVAAPVRNSGGLLASAENVAVSSPGGARTDEEVSAPVDAPPPDVGSPAPPAEPVDTAGQDPNLFNGSESDADGVTDDNNRGAPPLVAPSLPTGITERAFSGDVSERDLAALMSSDALTLPQLRALERKLQREASRLRSQSKKLNKEVKARARR